MIKISVSNNTSLVTKRGAKLKIKPSICSDVIVDLPTNTPIKFILITGNYIKVITTYGIGYIFVYFTNYTRAYNQKH